MPPPPVDISDLDPFHSDISSSNASSSHLPTSTAIETSNLDLLTFDEPPLRPRYQPPRRMSTLMESSTGGKSGSAGSDTTPAADRDSTFSPPPHSAVDTLARMRQLAGHSGRSDLLVTEPPSPPATTVLASPDVPLFGTQQAHDQTLASPGQIHTLGSPAASGLAKFGSPTSDDTDDWSDFQDAAPGTSSWGELASGLASGLASAGHAASAGLAAEAPIAAAHFGSLSRKVINALHATHAMGDTPHDASRAPHHATPTHSASQSAPHSAHHPSLPTHSATIDVIAPITLTQSRPGARLALTPEIAGNLRKSLPARLQIPSKWSLVYALDQHGVSLATLYQKCQDAPLSSTSGFVLVVRDSEGVFGAFINEPLHVSSVYYGDSSCFLWKADNSNSTQIFKWTGKNDYFILSDNSCISVGGGDGRFGLYIDRVLEKGFTTSCPCFDNDPLTQSSVIGVNGHPEKNFSIVALELWLIKL